MLISISACDDINQRMLRDFLLACLFRLSYISETAFLIYLTFFNDSFNFTLMFMNFRANGQPMKKIDS